MDWVKGVLATTYPAQQDSCLTRLPTSMSRQSAIKGACLSVCTSTNVG